MANAKQKRAITNKCWPYVILIVAGILLIFLPSFTSLISVALEMLLGWLLAAPAVLQIGALLFSKEKKDISAWLLAVLMLGIGLFFLLAPVSALKLMTFLFAVAVLVSGIVNIVQAFSIQGKLKTVLIVNGIIGLAFAVMIWAQWPASGVNFFGVLFGIYLVLFGVSQLVLHRKALSSAR